MIVYKSSLILSKPDLCLTVADRCLEIQQKLLSSELLGIDLPYICLKFVDLFDLRCNGRLKQTFQLRGLISDVGLKYLSVILEICDLTLNQFSEIEQVRTIFVESVTQKSTHLLHEETTT